MFCQITARPVETFRTKVLCLFFNSSVCELCLRSNMQMAGSRCQKPNWLTSLGLCQSTDTPLKYITQRLTNLIIAPAEKCWLTSIGLRTTDNTRIDLNIENGVSELSVLSIGTGRIPYSGSAGIKRPNMFDQTNNSCLGKTWLSLLC